MRLEFRLHKWKCYQATLIPVFSINFWDYKVHRDEIHTKLVQIMRERVFFHLRGLPHIVESWNKPEDADSQPSVFATSVTKEPFHIFLLNCCYNGAAVYWVLQCRNSCCIAIEFVYWVLQCSIYNGRIDRAGIRVVLQLNLCQCSIYNG